MCLREKSRNQNTLIRYLYLKIQMTLIVIIIILILVVQHWSCTEFTFSTIKKNKKRKSMSTQCPATNATALARDFIHRLL